MNVRITLALCATLSPTLLTVCAPSEEQDLGIGKASQKSYSIEYQSAKCDGKRIYRVRNTPSRVLTPVTWKMTGEIFLEWNLPACKNKEKACEWVEVIILTGEIDKGDTELGYGLNADECRDKPQAYVRGKPVNEERCGEKEEKQKPKFPPLETTIRGTVADIEGKEYAIDLTAKSEVKKSREPGLVELHYTLTLNKSLDSSIALFQAEPKTPLIVWHSADSKQYRDSLMNVRPTALTKKNPAASLTVKDVDERRVERRDKMLVLTVDKKKLASVSAPAYAPKED